jgi:predicted AlkP superfamily phosphohydrolase/phosphomutase
MERSKKGLSARRRILLRLLLALSLLAALTGCGGRPKPKVFVLGVDGITFDLMTPWIEQGKLPNFAELIQQGSATELISVVPTFSPPAWTTAVTGVNPGKHGIFGYVRDIAHHQGDPQLIYYTALDRTADPLWVVLTERGRRSIVMNIPCTAPPDSLNGIMISGFPQTSPTNYTYPADFRLRIPDYRVDHMGRRMAAEGEAVFLDNLNEIMDRRTEVILELVDQEQWDLFFAVLTITDRVQHYFWKHMDSRHPLWEPDMARQWGETILETYQRVDDFLGRLRTRLGPETTLIVMSDHGFGPVYQIVNSHNFLSTAMPEGKFQAMAKDHLGVNFSLYVKKGTPYTQENVQAMAETRDLLKNTLTRLRDPATNQPVISQLIDREQLYTGSQTKGAPHILGLESEGYLIWNWYPTEDGETFPSWRQPQYETLLTGFHRLNGVLIMAGEHVQKGLHRFDAQLMDIAPTLLYLLGEPIPENMDGKVLEAPISTAFTAAHPIEARWDRIDRSAQVKTASDSARVINQYIEEQLRSIGYVH